MLAKHDNNILDFVLDTMDVMIYVVDIETYELVYVNKQVIEEFGDIHGEICYKILQKNKHQPCEFCSLQDPENNVYLGASFKWQNHNTINNKEYAFSDRIIQWKDGRNVKVQVGIDISTQKKLESSLLEEKDNAIESFEALSNSTIEALIIYDDEKRCIKVNQVAPELFGYHALEMIGKDAMHFVSKQSQALVQSVISNYNQEPYEALMQRKDGTTFPALVRGRDLKLAGRTIRVSAVMDITNIKEKEEEISKLAYFDTLTSLPNRAQLSHKAEAFMRNSQKEGFYGALMFIDLDNFKNVNDAKGHLIGDEILKECAHRLNALIEPCDVIARFGGDEFVILLHCHTAQEQQALVCAKEAAQGIIKVLEVPFVLQKNDFRLSASIGIRTFLGEQQSFHELLKFADSALSYSKEMGKGTWSFYNPSLQNEIERKALLTERLYKAVEQKKGIGIFYQKQFSCDDEVIGIELLLRWQDDLLGIISPFEFIPIAEESGLIIPLGEFVLQEALNLLEQWKTKPSKASWRISVNVSSKQFERTDFVHRIETLLNSFCIDTSKLRLEITESLLLKDTQDALDKIQYLKSLGISFSIDDFGTGYSSLSYLKQLPVDELKIDKSFIVDILTDKSDENIVETILSLGKSFDFEVIAEGVETFEIKEKLHEIGCMAYQGYYRGLPESIDLI